jgi:hypothetical protein
MVLAPIDGLQPKRVLQQKFRDLDAALEFNQYGEPVYIKSRLTVDTSFGEVYAVLSHPFRAVQLTLSSPRNWCTILLLHINVKACDVQDSGESTPTNGSQLILYVGTKRFQPLQNAYPMNYEFRVNENTENFIQVSLVSAQGPVSTSDYQIAFEAMPNDAQSSLIHLTYSYRYGWATKLAVSGYLASLGREKVGFSIIGYDDRQKPIYVKGVQGIIERNAMRYFLAIQSYLDTGDGIAEDARLERRISRWFDLTQRFQRQLYELPRLEYIDMKRKEFARHSLSSAGLTP